MKMNCPNCESQEWHEGQDVFVVKTNAEFKENRKIERMILRPHICQSCGLTLFFLVKEAESELRFDNLGE